MNSALYKKHHWKPVKCLVCLGFFIEMLKQNYFRIYGLKLVLVHFYFIISFLICYYDSLYAHLYILFKKFILAEFRKSILLPSTDRGLKKQV